MTRAKRLIEQERMEILRAAAEGVSTSVLAIRFGVTPRAVRYTLQADRDRQRDTGVAVVAVTVKLTPGELAALDVMLASAGIATRTDGIRRLIQAAGGVFVPDAHPRRLRITRGLMKRFHPEPAWASAIEWL